MANSSFVSTATWNGWINEYAKALYDLLVAADADYYTVSVSISTNGTDRVYGLPSDFYKLRGVDYTSEGTLTAMQKYEWSERNTYRDTGGTRLRYRVVAGNMHFEPLPAAQDITLWYIPSLEVLDADADTFDGVNGWEAYIEMCCARRALALEESSTTDIDAEIVAMEARIKRMAPSRDHGEPDRITDVSGSGELGEI